MSAVPVAAHLRPLTVLGCFLLDYIVCIVKIVPDCLSKFCDSSGVFYVLIRQELPSVFLG